MSIDKQGRAVITDHGAFVLFNVYLPATTNSQDARFKVRAGAPIDRRTAGFSSSRLLGMAFNDSTGALENI